MTISYKNTTFGLLAFLSALIMMIIALSLTIYNKKNIITRSVKSALSLHSGRRIKTARFKPEFARLGVKIPDNDKHGASKMSTHPVETRQHRIARPIRAFGVHRDAVLLCQNPHYAPPERPFSLPSAKFAALLITKLEVPAAARTTPQSFDDNMQVLAFLSGKTKNKNENIGWVVKIEDADDADLVHVWVAFRGTQTKAEWKQDFKVKQVPMVALTSHPRSPVETHAQLPTPTRTQFPLYQNTSTATGAFAAAARKLAAAVPAHVGNQQQDRGGAQKQTPKTTPETNMLVHQGFYEAYQDIQQDLIDTLTRHYRSTPKKTELYISGHSLGAAIAEIALADIVLVSHELRDLVTSVKCYLFGAPRVGNQVFVDAVLDQCRAHTKASRIRVLGVPYCDAQQPSQTNTVNFEHETTGLGTASASAPTSTPGVNTGTAATLGPKVSEFVIFVNDDDIVPNIPLAVQPNFGDPDHPWIYAQFPVLRFSANWGNWTENHTLPIHIDYLNKL